MKKKYNLKNISGSIATEEMLIDVEKSKKYFFKKLKSYLYLNHEIKKIRKVKISLKLIIMSMIMY